MQVIKPTPSQAAFVLKNFMAEHGAPMQLARAQEAVARMEGFANWNALTSAMDPRVGTPSGGLKLLGNGQYEMTSEAAEGVSVNVGIARVRMVPGDQYGFVEVYFDKEASVPDHTVWIKGPHRMPTAPTPLFEKGSTAHLLRSLFQVESVQDDSCPRPADLMFLNNELILEELEEPGTADDERSVLKFHNGKSTVCVSLRELKNAAYFGGCSWQLPDGNVLVVHSRLVEDDTVDADTRELLRRLIAEGVTINLPRTDGPTPLTHKDTEYLEAALYGWNVEPAAEVIRYLSRDKEDLGITLHALLTAYQEAADSWRLPSGQRMDVIPAEFSNR